MYVRVGILVVVIVAAFLSRKQRKHVRLKGKKHNALFSLLVLLIGLARLSIQRASKVLVYSQQTHFLS